MTLILTTTVNGKHVESHEVTDTEAWLFKTALGLDLKKIASGELAAGAPAAPEQAAEPEPPQRTPEQIAASEREALIRAIHAVEAAARRLPKTRNSIAGFLFGNNIKGNDTPTDNPLANYYRQAVADMLNNPSGPAFELKDLVIRVQGSGTSLETPRFLLSIDPTPGSSDFLESHRLGRYRELWAY